MDLIVALIGSLVGGGFALAGVVFAHRLNAQRQLAQDRELVRAFLAAILVELETDWRRHQQTTGPAIAGIPSGEPFLNEVLIHTDYFTVYHGNSHMIGRVEDDELRRMIVATYTRYKAMVGHFIFNTRLLTEMREAELLFRATGNPYYRTRMEERRADLARFAGVIKWENERLGQEVSELTSALKVRIAPPAHTSAARGRRSANVPEA